MVSLIHNIVIEKKKWITEEEMLDIIAIAESTPGPMAINTSTFVGYKQAGILGGIISTLGTITPSLIIITIIAYFYDKFIQIELVQKAFSGIICAVAVLIIAAAIKLGKTVLKNGYIYISIPIIVIVIVISLLTSFSPIILILIGGIIGGVIYSLMLKEKIK